MADELTEAQLGLHVMCDALKRDARDLLTGVGSFRAKKKLANGSVVIVTITNPPRDETRATGREAGS